MRAWADEKTCQFSLREMLGGQAEETGYSSHMDIS
jgi:hypothetical protein